MSVLHTTAVYECDQFKGNTRSLLLALAYYAYDKGPYPRGFPDPGFGWGYRGEDFFMECLNINRRQTISGCYTELEEAGAIQRKRRWHNTSLTFVDLDWLLANRRTEVTVDVTSDRLTTTDDRLTESVTSVPTESVTTLCHEKRDNHLTESVTRSTSSLIYGVQRRVHLDKNHPADTACGRQKIGTEDGGTSTVSLETLKTRSKSTPTPPTTSKPFLAKLTRLVRTSTCLAVFHDAVFAST